MDTYTYGLCYTEEEEIEKGFMELWNLDSADFKFLDEGGIVKCFLVGGDSLCYPRASVHTSVCLPYVRGLEPVYVRRYVCHTYVD